MTALSLLVSSDSGADELRAVVALLNNSRESSLDNFTAEELLTIARAVRAGEWDVTIDQLTPDQRRAAALDGAVPSFVDNPTSPAAPVHRVPVAIRTRGGSK